jgi:hypothetical protein
VRLRGTFARVLPDWRDGRGGLRGNACVRVAEASPSPSWSDPMIAYLLAFVIHGIAHEWSKKACGVSV